MPTSLADTTPPLIDETHPIPATFEVVSMSATTSLLTLPASRSVAPSVSPFDQPSHLTVHSPCGSQDFRVRLVGVAFLARHCPLACRGTVGRIQEGPDVFTGSELLSV